MQQDGPNIFFAIIFYNFQELESFSEMAVWSLSRCQEWVLGVWSSKTLNRWYETDTWTTIKTAQDKILVYNCPFQQFQWLAALKSIVRNPTLRCRNQRSSSSGALEAPLFEFCLVAVTEHVLQRHIYCKKCGQKLTSWFIRRGGLNCDLSECRDLEFWESRDLNDLGILDGCHASHVMPKCHANNLTLFQQ